MSLRALSRVLLLALAFSLLSPLLWAVADLPVLQRAAIGSLLAGPGLLLLALGYLALQSGRGPTTRWQVRYYLPSAGGSEREGTDSQAEQESADSRAERQGTEYQAALERLNAVFRFLDDRDTQPVVEANARGLFLELSAAFDEYIQVQFKKTLPEARIVEVDNNSKLAGNCYLCLDPPSRDVLRWATEAAGRQVRLHLIGPFVTLTAESTGIHPPGRWVRVPVPRFAVRLWRHLPLWDELSAGTQLGDLLPFTDAEAVYSSRSRLLRLAPPPDYRPAESDRSHRRLGQAIDGQSLTLPRTVALLTAGAPHAFLVDQAIQDLANQATVVVSPHRSVLHQIRIRAHHRQGSGTPRSTVLWLDQDNSQPSAHLAVTAAEEWDRLNVPLLVRLTQTFLADASSASAQGPGLNVKMPATQTISRRLIYVLAASARATGHSFTFTDLYAISQSLQALRAFLTDLQQLFPESEGEIHNHVQALLNLMGEERGYRQIVAVLGGIRSALDPLRTGPLHTLSQPPFLDANRALGAGALVLVPLHNAEFPRHDRLLSAMLDLVLSRVLVTAGEDFRLALHLHDPHLYRRDAGRRWLDVARRDRRLTLLLDVQEPAAYHTHIPDLEDGRAAELIFRCSEPLASALVGDRQLPCTITDLMELPAGTALACLPDMLVALKTENNR